LKDLSDKVRDVSNVGHYSHGDSEIVVSNPSDIPSTREELIVITVARRQSTFAMYPS
jgi:predicted transport protein